MNLLIEKVDNYLITWLHKWGDEFGRVSLFIIFFWFGILKLYNLSPAGPLVESLMQVTVLSNIPAQQFLIFFGAFEAITGVLILIPKLERVTFILLFLHLCTTVMPLFLLPEVTWVIPGVAATLTGQYIIKNLALLSVGLFLYARITPIAKTKHFLAVEEN